LTSFCSRNLLKYLYLSLLTLVPAIVAGQSPQSINIPFSNPLLLSPAESAGYWYTDRFAPCLFMSQETAPDGTRNTLEESICTSGYQTPAPSFFNTQGRKYDLVTNTISVSIYVYVPSAWATLQERKAGFWATAANSTGVVGNDYPIIEFQGPITADNPVGPGYYSNGGVAGFYGWDNSANGGNGAFTFIGLPLLFKYNSWVELTMTLVPGVGFQYSVSDPLLHLGPALKTKFYDATETSLSNVILEGYNYNQNYSIFWNNLSLSSTSLVCSGGLLAPLKSLRPLMIH
jgi:hypothetical protein